MEERNLNEKESLELISRMIENTQKKLSDKNGLPFLIWGYVSVLVSILIWYLLKTTQNAYWNFLWFLIPVLGFSIMLTTHKTKQRGVKTYIDHVIIYVWSVLGTTAFITSLSSFIWKIPILFIIILLMGAGTTITALIIKFKPLVYSGIIGLLLSVVCLMVANINVILVFALIFVIMMIVPGHILHAKKTNSHV